MRDGRLHEIKSAVILTPGPVAISAGACPPYRHFDLSNIRPQRTAYNRQPLSRKIPMKIAAPASP